MKNQRIKLNGEKGITLVALIITIIVLVILAAVAIMEAYKSGIIQLATKGTLDYTKAQVDETKGFNDIGVFLDHALEELDDIANEKKLLAPGISVEGQKREGYDWYCGDVVVTITDEVAEKNSRAKKIKYEIIKDGETKEETLDIPTGSKREIKVTISEEGISKLKAYILDGNGNKIENTKEEEIKIDKTAPIDVKIIKKEQTVGTITVEAEGKDLFSNIKCYIYQYKESSENDEEWKNAPEGVEIQNKTYRYPSEVIKENKNYDVRVIVIDNAGNKTASEKETVIIKNANYSIAFENETLYYNTLEEAYIAAISDGGEVGGTIVVEKNVDEDVPQLDISKTITIDTNAKIMGRNSRLYVTSGTLTIKGYGKIYHINDTKNLSNPTSRGSAMLIVGDGGNIVINDNPTIESISHALFTESGSVGIVDINGGTLISTEYGGCKFNGNGDVTINDAVILALGDNKNGIACDNGVSPKCNLTIGGNSIIANGIVDKNASNAVISFGSAGNITIENDAIITGCMYGGPAINIYKPSTEVTIKDNAQLYSGANGGRAMVILATGITLNISTTEGIYSKNYTIGCDGVSYNNVTNITKGSFGGTNQYPLDLVKNCMDNYPTQEGTQQVVKFPYFEQGNYKEFKYSDQQIYVVDIGK